MSGAESEFKGEAHGTWFMPDQEAQHAAEQEPQDEAEKEPQEQPTE